LLIRELLEAQFPRWANLPVAEVPDWGTDNALYRLGHDMVMRLPRTPRTTAALEKELRWLPIIGPLLPLATLFRSRLGSLARAIRSRGPCTHGSTATRRLGARIADERQAAADLARFVASLWRIDSVGGPPPGEHNVFRGVQLATRDEVTRAAIRSLSGTINGDAVTSAWEASLAVPEWPRAGVWVHGDLHSRNLLVDNGWLSAVIDFGCLGVGDLACDIAVAWKLFGAETRALFREELSVDDATWLRSRGWSVSQALIAPTYYTPETYAVLVREARTWIAAIPEDRGEGRR
jgi:aminoglycoside phosphotransferase (APT) family kinase protein